MAAFELIMVVLGLLTASVAALTHLMRSNAMLRRGVGGHFLRGERAARRWPRKDG